MLEDGLAFDFDRVTKYKLLNFVHNRPTQKGLLYLYISAMQNNQNSQSALAYKFLNGIDV